ncbi:MAG: sigma 54-interacting transcriptional regulator [Phycisphaerae bacterium]|nr:sigma 54-interacting transcriptional regulator [Phycisphaerae bacterium]
MSGTPNIVGNAGAGAGAEVPLEACGDPVLDALLRGVSARPGREIYERIARALAESLGVRYAVIAEFVASRGAARSVAFWRDGAAAETVEWSLAGSPCEAVVGGAFCHVADGAAERYPADRALADLGVRSYMGVPLRAPGGAVLGHLFVMDDKPMPGGARHLALFRIFAACAAGEMVRADLERSLAQSEERFRDLFDEAPIAYVHEGLDTRFIRANRAAMRILGIRPEEVEGTYGRSFVPDTPEAQRRLADALAAINAGRTAAGVVLELRRKDNGKPVWIQWWSRPDPSGAFTRTMFLDVTEKVLMEREAARLAAQNRYLREEIRAANQFGDIVGSSRGLAAVLESVDRVAPTDSTVLIEGETGVGKELVARAVHDRSARRAGPFVKVNCAALPAGLVESEFFGHEKGAFTGAVAARRGRFELADGGTIFLDEVGEVSPEVQVKLLRVLQESEFERVGGTETIRVNVRVIAATNRDLAAEVAAGRFRADLFYRLSVFPIRVPPLRERADDIPILAAFFATTLAAAVGKKFEGIEPESMERLRAYRWPGNIRELRNVLERAVILCSGPVLRIDAEAAGGGAGGAPGAGRGSMDGAGLTLDEMERRHIAEALRRTGGAIAGPKGAAKALGVPPSTLRSRMARLGMKG